MNLSDLAFIGIAGSVVALNKATGKQAWATRLKGYGFVNILVQDEQLLATVYGEAFCLEPLTGRIIWRNPLKGFGRGLAGIAMAGCSSNVAGLAEQQRMNEQSDAGATAAAVA
jgi:outer membrane protein assembly factor BamB